MAPPNSAPAGAASATRGETKSTPGPDGLEPIGASHFESPNTMTIARGTSAMISIFDTATDGEVVYLHDPESPVLEVAAYGRTIS
jgi:hypothetical protein